MINESNTIIKDTSVSISYTKTGKLITALYMVTDMIDINEPIRNKLRTLGLEILSDIISISRLNLDKKLQEILSFLDIASAINMISEMNCNILKKEFSELNRSIKDSNSKVETPNGQIDLSEFFADSSRASLPHPNPLLVKEREKLNYKGHTRIGVQKGSTLMKALSDKTYIMSDSNSNGHISDKTSNVLDNFYLIKKERRYNIIQSIKENGGYATITDIRNKALGNLVSCSEKTLQRELVSMIKDGVLEKTGEKRWSRYKLALAL